MFQNGQTFGQQLAELAEAVGIAVPDDTSVGGISLPTNDYELKKLIRKFNEGQRIIALSSPSGWYVLRPIIYVNLTTDTSASQVIDGDISTYRIPSYAHGQPFGDWSWTNVAGNLKGTADSVTWEEVTGMLHANTGGSLPAMVATRTITEQVSHGVDRVVLAVRVYPRPMQAFTLFAPFNVSVPPLVDLEQRHPWGPLLDPLTIAAAKWAWVKDDTTDNRYAAWKAEFDNFLALAIGKDKDHAAHYAGNLYDWVDNNEGRIRIPSEVTLNGVLVG